MPKASIIITTNIYRLLAVLWIVVISYLSLARFSSPVSDVRIPHLDKLVHFAMYFGLTFILLRSFTGISKWWIFSFAALFGFLMEYAQLEFTDYRNFDIYDLIANIIGALSCIIFTKRF